MLFAVYNHIRILLLQPARWSLGAHGVFHRHVERRVSNYALNVLNECIHRGILNVLNSYLGPR